MTWLSYHKRKWKLQMVRRQEKKQLLRQQERGVATNGGFPETTPSHDLAGFLRQQNRALIDLHWQIIQVGRNPQFFASSPSLGAKNQDPFPPPPLDSRDGDPGTVHPLGDGGG